MTITWYSTENVSHAFENETIIFAERRSVGGGSGDGNRLKRGNADRRHLVDVYGTTETEKNTNSNDNPRLGVR